MPQSLGWHVWLGATITIVPATAAVATRFVARQSNCAGLREDDWLILAALIVAWAMTAIRYYGLLHLGLGYHADALPHGTVERYQKTFLAVQITYFTTAVLTKTSILLLYKRIFGVYEKFRKVIWAAVGLVVSYFIICTVLAIVGCQPISYFWDKDQPGKCMNEVQFFRWNGVTNLILDLLVLCIPIPMIWNLHLRLGQKMAFSAIFGLGGFACLASILRIIQFEKSRQADPTYTTVDSGTWSSVEQGLGIICACLPTLGPLFRRSRDDSNYADSGPPSRSSDVRLSYRTERRDSDQQDKIDPTSSHHTGTVTELKEQDAETESAMTYKMYLDSRSTDMSGG